MTALLVRYFEILGIATEQAGLIDWSAAPHPEEAEDAYARYADLKTTSARKIGTSGEGPAYQFDRSQPVPARFVTRKFDLARVRAAAKTYDATVSEYVLAHIFRAIAHDRAARGSSEPITAMVPIDCRSFFPTETYRNFVAEETIVMPETADLAMMVQQLSRQFARIDADLVRAEISANEKLRKNIRFLPRVAAKLIVKMVERSMNRGLTTAFTNLGLVELPGEVEERVEMLEFVVADAPGIPYRFACVTGGDALTLTTTMSVEDRGLTERAAEGLEG